MELILSVSASPCFASLNASQALLWCIIIGTTYYTTSRCMHRPLILITTWRLSLYREIVGTLSSSWSAHYEYSVALSCMYRMYIHAHVSCHLSLVVWRALATHEGDQSVGIILPPVRGMVHEQMSCRVMRCTSLFIMVVSTSLTFIEILEAGFTLSCVLYTYMYVLLNVSSTVRVDRCSTYVWSSTGTSSCVRMHRKSFRTMQ